MIHVGIGVFQKRNFTGKGRKLVHFLSRMCTWTKIVTTRSVVSSASGEWQELKLFLGVIFGLGQDDSLGYRFSGDAGPNPRDIWRGD